MQNNRPTIMVVDNDEISCAAVESVLSMFNYEVIAVHTADSAIKCATAAKIDAIVISIELPEGGFPLSQQIRKLEGCFDLPLAFATKGEIDHALMMEAQFYGGLFLFHQPYNEVELLTQISSMVSIKRLQDELKQKMAELDLLASTDPLTGLSNRRLFFQRLEEELSRAQRSSSPITVIFLDIDHFKEINDSYGHQAGDLVLKQLSKIMTRLLRASDVLGRVGGEEFMIILPDTPQQPSAEVAERLRKRVEDSTFCFDNTEMPITVSLGVNHVIKPLAGDLDEIVKAADVALYEAKAAGRNKVIFSKPEDESNNSASTEK